ncbi:MAG: flagellar hook-basal body complex protein FliE [Planctomycetaceae bacterium]
MANTIGRLGMPPLPKVGPLTPADASPGGDAGFQQLLKSALQSTSALQNDAQASIETQLSGGDITNAEVMTDLRKADLALRMMLQIRNKLLEAFDEIKQMQF